MSRTLLLLAVIVTLLGLAGLACEAESMRARELPVWSCPTVAPAATHTMPASSLRLTPPPATYTPWPTATPYELLTDFPLGRAVRVGGLGGVGGGIRVWMDEVSVTGPVLDSDESPRWIAQWTVTVENASWSTAYEAYPFAQVYVLEVADASGAATRTGAWAPSAEAHDLVGLDPLALDEASVTLAPGETRRFAVAAFVPGPDVLRLAYVLDPLEAASVAEMARTHSLGRNVGVWLTTASVACGPGEVAFLPRTATADPGYGPLLARHPVDAVVIARGFGCSSEFTGELGTSCPADAPWFHNGVDYVVPAGSGYSDPLPVAGQVDYAGADSAGLDCSAMAGSQPPHSGYGLFVRHSAEVDGHTVTVWGAHLSSTAVETGDSTEPGSVLGAVGSTGCSTGSHLHFSVRVDGIYVDPLTLIP